MSGKTEIYKNTLILYFRVQKIGVFFAQKGNLMAKSKTVKILSLLMSLIFALFAFSACDNVSGTDDEGLPELIIGTDMYDPYYYLDEDGNPTGIDVEIAKEACRRMGYEPVFKSIDWLNKNDAFGVEDIDCIWTCFSMNGRENLYQWAGPYCYDKQVVAVLADSKIYTLDDLTGETVGVQMDSLPEQILSERTDERIPDVGKIYCLTTLKESISALRRQYISACIGHEAALRAMLEDMGVEYRVLKEPLVVSKTGIAFKLGDTRGICEKLQETLDEMIEDGTIDEILVRYGLEKLGDAWR